MSRHLIQPMVFALCGLGAYGSIELCMRRGRRSLSKSSIKQEERASGLNPPCPCLWHKRKYLRPW
jgi:hypothetical protein